MQPLHIRHATGDGMPEEAMEVVYKKYKSAEFCWVQEEPQNMGAWTYLISNPKNSRLRLISRRASPSVATGYYKIHQQEQESIIKEALAK